MVWDVETPAEPLPERRLPASLHSGIRQDSRNSAVPSGERQWRLKRSMEALRGPEAPCCRAFRSFADAKIRGAAAGVRQVRNPSFRGAQGVLIQLLLQAVLGPAAGLFHLYAWCWRRVSVQLPKFCPSGSCTSGACSLSRNWQAFVGSSVPVTVAAGAVTRPLAAVRAAAHVHGVVCRRVRSMDATSEP
jgi:hypothetical protein